MVWDLVYRSFCILGQVTGLACLLKTIIRLYYLKKYKLKIRLLSVFSFLLLSNKYTLKLTGVFS